MKFLLILALLFSGCVTTSGSHPTGLLTHEPRPTRYFDPQLEQIYDWYMEDAQKHDMTPILAPQLLTMKFVDSYEQEAEDEDEGYYIAGMCSIDEDDHGDKYTEITVLRDAWDEDQPFKNRMLVYHELTHCLFLLGHSEIANTIMAGKQEAPEEYWAEGWDTHVDLLFDFIKNGGKP